MPPRLLTPMANNSMTLDECSSRLGSSRQATYSVRACASHFGIASNLRLLRRSREATSSTMIEYRILKTIVLGYIDLEHDEQRKLLIRPGDASIGFNGRAIFFRLRPLGEALPAYLWAGRDERDRWLIQEAEPLWITNDPHR